MTRNEKVKKMFKEKRKALGRNEKFYADLFNIKISSFRTMESNANKISIEWYVMYCKMLGISKEEAIEAIWEGNDEDVKSKIS